MKLNFSVLLSAWVLSVGSFLPIQAKPVVLEKGQVTLEVPDDFTPLTPEDFGEDGTRPVSPHGYGNPNRSLTIASAPSGSITLHMPWPDFKREIVVMTAKLNPTKVIKHEEITLHGTSWVRIELQDPTGKQVHQTHLMTIHQDHVLDLIFTFDKSRYEAINAMINSLKVSQSETSPSPAK